MRATICGRMARFWTVALLCLTIGACMSSCDPDPIEGTYHHTAGAPMTLDFKKGKVTVTIAGDSETFDYTAEGDRIIIKNPEEGDLTVTRNADGSLNTGWGTFAKRAA